MAPIGRKHAALRRLRALVRDPARRRAEGVFVAEGVHLAREALSCGVSIETAFVAPRLGATAEGAALRGRLESAAGALWEAADEALDAAQDTRTPQPVALVVRARAVPVAEALAARPGPALVVVAWGVQDPGNLGSLLRSADAAGATGFLACEAGADPLHPRAVRASMGSVFRLPVTRAPFDVVRDTLSRRGIRLLAALPSAADYAARDWTGPVAIVLGREGEGLPEEVARACDGSIGIPMRGGVESLSVAAAGAVVLFEAARQRRLTTSG